jgi:hypothetical protein
MTYLIAFILGLTTIIAPTSATLPTYLTEVSTTKAPVVEAPEAPVCEEDMPCWDCSTMGNLQCGPIAEAPICEEDMPCWDCETMGNGQCGIDPNMEQDAYVSYDSQTGNPANTEDLSLTYVSTVPLEPVDLLPTQFAIPSSNLEGVWHIMQWDPTSHA